MELSAGSLMLASGISWHRLTTHITSLPLFVLLPFKWLKLLNNVVKLAHLNITIHRQQCVIHSNVGKGGLNLHFKDCKDL